MEQRITKIGQKQSSGDMIQYPIGAEGDNISIDATMGEDVSLQDWVEYIEEELESIHSTWEPIVD